MNIPPHPRLKEVENAANFIALVQDNFEVLAGDVAKREPTYQNGGLTTIGPPTRGRYVFNEFQRGTPQTIEPYGFSVPPVFIPSPHRASLKESS